MVTKAHFFGCIIATALTVIASVILIITSIIYTRQTSILSDSWPQIFSLSIYSIVIGILALITSIGLLYVTSRKFPALTTVFSSALLVVGIASAICMIILFTGQVDLHAKTYNRTVDLYSNYSTNGSVPSSQALMDKIQQEFECCGIIVATDWQRQGSFPDNSSVPDSCCRVSTRSCGQNGLAYQGRIFLRGCFEPIYLSLQRKYKTLIGMNITVMVLVFITALAGFIFERSIHKEYQTM